MNNLTKTENEALLHVLGNLHNYLTTVTGINVDAWLHSENGPGFYLCCDADFQPDAVKAITKLIVELSP